jgi:monoamine oxidase
MGAEFIHGRPREIRELFREKPDSICEAVGDTWCAQDGRLSRCRFFEDVQRLLQNMESNGADESFLEFLDRQFPENGASPQQLELRRRALAYVSGFHAADPAKVGVQWLVKEQRAEDAMEGDRTFRLRGGYCELIEIFTQRLDRARAVVATDTVVSSVRWKAGEVQIAAFRLGESLLFDARAVVITLPLGVLQSPDGIGTVRFAPELPDEKKWAFGKLEMGMARRITLVFAQRFWEGLPGTAGLGKMRFLLSPGALFPTWWTLHPQPGPILTGWAPWQSAQELAGHSSSEVAQRAVETLSRLLQVSEEKLAANLRQAYSYDWQSDPFSRGAYSYGAVDARPAIEELARPVESTLFFAGEAVDTSGNNGTVQGAIASGQSAAQQVLAVLQGAAR